MSDDEGFGKELREGGDDKEELVTRAEEIKPALKSE